MTTRQDKNLRGSAFVTSPLFVVRSHAGLCPRGVMIAWVSTGRRRSSDGLLKSCLDCGHVRDRPVNKNVLRSANNSSPPERQDSSHSHMPVWGVCFFWRPSCRATELIWFQFYGGRPVSSLCHRCIFTPATVWWRLKDGGFILIVGQCALTKLSLKTVKVNRMYLKNLSLLSAIYLNFTIHSLPRVDDIFKIKITLICQWGQNNILH